MNSLTGRILLVAWLLGAVTLTSLWFLIPGTVVRITPVEDGQVVDILGLNSNDRLAGGMVLEDGAYQVALPFELEVPSRLIGRRQIEIVGSPGAPILVAVRDKFGQTFRGRGEQVQVWQGPVLNAGVSAGPIQSVLRTP